MESYRGSSMAQEVKYCCQDKKYFSELCSKCIEDMTTFNPDNLDYPHYSEYSAQEWTGSTSESRCECGSNSVSGPGHSHWCPKHE